MPTPNKNNNKTVRKEYKKEIMKRTAGSYFRGSDMESRVGEKVRKFSSSLPLEQLGDMTFIYNSVSLQYATLRSLAKQKIM